MRKKSIKISMPVNFFETIQENASSMGMSISEYMNYLIYKENYLHFSMHNSTKDKNTNKFYEIYHDEVNEQGLWKVMFNI